MYLLYAAIFLIVIIILLVVIYLIAENAFNERLVTLKRLGIAGIPNPEFFKFIWPLFIFAACISFLPFLDEPLIMFRAVGMIGLTIITAFLLFGTNGFTLWPFAAISLFSLIILLGEMIYTFGIVKRCRIAASLLGFYFFWSIYALYITLTTLSLFISNATFEIR